MARARRQGLRSGQLSFIGKVLASFSHELSNHLAVIKESAGLMGDLMELEKPSSAADRRQGIETLRRIEQQVNKSSSLCRYLGRFAHRMDLPLSTFSVNETLEELVVLLNRTARQRRIALEREFDDRLPPIESDPLRLQFVVFSLVDAMMAGLEAKSALLLKTAVQEGAVSVEIVPRGNGDSAAPGAAGRELCSDELLQETILDLGGRLSWGDRGGIRIELPLGR